VKVKRVSAEPDGPQETTARGPERSQPFFVWTDAGNELACGCTCFAVSDPFARTGGDAA
jgi:hypothetical protein